MTTWWDSATQEQRLAQIDGAIECGMTVRQFLACIGMENPTKNMENAVSYFSRKHGRNFYGKSVFALIALHNGGRRASGAPETSANDAFAIFDGKTESGSLFDAHQNDGELFA